MHGLNAHFVPAGTWQNTGVMRHLRRTLPRRAKDPAAVRKNHARRPSTIGVDEAFAVGTSCAQHTARGFNMINITKVLVATDFSDASESALLYGREFARTFGAALHVLHVTENPVVWTGAESAGVDFVRMQADIEEGARNALNRIVTAEDRAQLKAVTAVLSDTSPAFEIASYARREGVDIILMGTHGRGMVQHLLMGSVAEKVVRIAPCPVLTVRSPGTRVHPSGCIGGRRRGEALTISATMPAAPATTSRLVLRDGSTAGVRPATGSDREALRRFFGELSPASRRLRFLAAANVSEELLTTFCDNSNPRKALTLIVCRRAADGTHVIGVGSYFADTEASAEVAFAVGDEFHGRGIATALLEHLALYGRDQNFEYFSASVLPENYEMLDVFRDSGFDVHSTTESGTVEVRLSLQPSTASVAAADERERLATIASLLAILKPRSVAVVGASRRDSNLGRRVFESLLASGFHGPVYAVNPSATELHGQRCYASPRDLPAWRRSRRYRSAARGRARGGGRLRGRRRKRDCRHLSGFRRVRRARPRAAGRARRASARLRHAHGRPQLHGGSQHRPRDRAECLVRGAPAAPRAHRACVAEWRSRARGVESRGHTADWFVDIREPRQQGGHLRQRYPSIRRARPLDVCRAALSRVVRQSATLRAAREARVTRETDCGRQIRPHRRRAARRRRAIRPDSPPASWPSTVSFSRRA